MTKKRRIYLAGYLVNHTEQNVAKLKARMQFVFLLSLGVAQRCRTHVRLLRLMCGCFECFGKQSIVKVQGPDASGAQDIVKSTTATLYCENQGFECFALGANNIVRIKVSNASEAKDM